MKILCIGGTKFVGRKIVEDAVARGHEVHILHRGKTNLNLHPAVVKKYLGDRKNIRELIPNEDYDMVVDTCGYHPEIVKVSCEYLKNKTKLYVFISTCSVYSDFSKAGLTEESELASMSVVPPIEDLINNENYGPLKVLCESMVKNNFSPENYLILRPCTIVGPYDDSKRFDKLINLIMKSKELFIPDDATALIQFVDVRAVSDFTLKVFEKKLSGVYNIIGPKENLTYIEFVEQAKKILNPSLKISFRNNSEDSTPMYVDDPNYNGFFQFDGKKAYNSSFKEIAVQDTILDTANYLKSF